MSEPKYDNETQEKIDAIMNKYAKEYKEKAKQGNRQTIPVCLVLLKEYKQFMPRGYNKIFDSIIPEVCEWFEHCVMEEQHIRNRDEKIIGRYEHLIITLQELIKEGKEML